MDPRQFSEHTVNAWAMIGTWVQAVVAAAAVVGLGVGEAISTA